MCSVQCAECGLEISGVQGRLSKSMLIKILRTMHPVYTYIFMMTVSMVFDRSMTAPDLDCYL